MSAKVEISPQQYKHGFKQFRIFVIVTLITIPGIALKSQSEYKYTRPLELNDGWTTKSLSAFASSTSQLQPFFNHLGTQEHYLNSILVVNKDHIVLEEYFNGASANKQHDLRSATKSISSILMGIAIDKGYIKHVDDTIGNYLSSAFKVRDNAIWTKIKISHLLNMSTGLDCNDWDKRSKGQEDKVYKKKDWIQYFLNLPFEHEPGEMAQYCTMAQVLATEIISRASGMQIDSFANKYLFKPLNITNVSWGHTTQNKEVLPSAKRLYMTSRDMAKIGQLMLQGGTYLGEQVVSEEWVKLSTSHKTNINGIAYGYLWWKIPFKIGKKKLESWAAMGNGGQYIFVLPELNTTIVFTGSAYNLPEDKFPFSIVQKVIIPSLLEYRQAN